jgi:hypothetical protein
MEDKIIEVFKKYSKSVDTEYNVYNCLIEEDWSNIAHELVKLFRQPHVMRSVCCDAELIKFKTYGYDECIECNKTYKQTDA